MADWIQAGEAPVNRGLAQHLRPKLATGKAGTLQESQGVSATAKFKELLDEKLTRPSGSKRRVFLRAADQPFDQYGRLLTYMAPSYSSTELASMTRKGTSDIQSADGRVRAGQPHSRSIRASPATLI